MSPIPLTFTVTSFQPDISGKIFLCAQTKDGGNIRVLVTEAQKGALTVGDEFSAVLGEQEAGDLAEAVEANTSLITENDALKASVANLTAELADTTALLDKATAGTGAATGDPAAPVG